MPYYVIYARKSTESEDRQVLSIPAQVEELHACASKRGVVVAKVVEESMSAKDPGRPKFGELMRQLARGEVAGILCWKLDRLARNPIDGAAVMWALSKKQLAEVVTPSRTFTSSSDDVLLMSIEFGMAKKYVDDLSDNVKRGLRARAQRGWHVTRPPAGYLADRNSHTVVVDPIRFPLLRRAMEYVLNGVRPSEVLHILNNVWGYRGVGRASTEEGCPLSRSNFYRLLGHPFYCGLFHFDGGVHKGSHQPMLSPEEFKDLQGVLRRQGRPRSSRHEWAYTGLFRCGACGGMITASWHRGRHGGRYPYYYCPRRNGCRQPYALVGDVDSQLAALFGRLTLPDAVVGWYIDALEELNQSSKETVRAIALSRERAKASVNRQLRTLTDLRVRNAIRDDEYLAQRERLLQEEASLGRPVQATDAFEPAQDVILALSKLKNRFASASLQNKRLLVDSICSNPRLLNKKLLLQAKKPFTIAGEGFGSLKSLGDRDSNPGPTR